jgi:hypothetical protein
MRAAYLNQAINLLVAMLMVPMLLRYLGVGDYILWAIFTTFGGFTLQIDSSIQILSVREIAKQYHGKDGAGVQRAVRRARKAYLMLASGVLGPFLIAGFLYLAYQASDKVGNHWGLEWLVFSATYATSYFFGANNSILLALAKVDVFNNVNSFTRAMYLVVSLLMLRVGFGVMGICISLALSVAVGCSLIAIAARKSLRDTAHASPDWDASSIQSGAVAAADLVRYTVFTFFSFALYKGGVLVAVSLFPKSEVGAYSLTLQAFTMLSALALVPIQIWLASFVKAIVADRRTDVIRELARTFLYANSVFVAGTGALILFGNTLLLYIGAHVTLPGRLDLLIVAAAFLVEVNLFVLINLLVIKRRYEFIGIYVACVSVGLLSALCAAWLTHDLIVSLIVVPCVVQTAVCLPLIVKRVCTEIKATPASFIALIYQHAFARR